MELSPTNGDAGRHRPTGRPVLHSVTGRRHHHAFTNPAHRDYGFRTDAAYLNNPTEEGRGHSSILGRALRVDRQIKTQPTRYALTKFQNQPTKLATSTRVEPGETLLSYLDYVPVGLEKQKDGIALHLVGT